ncbi:hypothetical protein GCM10018953_42960 [Streptosporangium nondiastaticum]
MKESSRNPQAVGTLIDLWAGTVQRRPDAQAVRDDRIELNYRELDRASNAVALQLIEVGVRPEDRVALYLRRSAGLFAGILGVLKAGGAYVAVDPRYPPARRDMMIEGSGADIVLTEPDWIGDVSARKVLSLPPRDTASDESLPPVPVQAKNAACVLFTSGSSGKPKATILEHGNIVSFARNGALPALTQNDRVGQISNVSFDAFHYETWCAFARAAQVVVLPALPDLLASDMQRTLRRLKVSAMLIPSMALNHIVREDREAFSPLRILHTGGDVIFADTCRDLLDGDFAGRFLNLYGPTEATTACTAFEIRRPWPVTDSVPIGKAIDGVHLYVLDEDLTSVEAGEVGQLHIGGSGVARGYLGDQGLTAERFLPDPFQADGTRMYATGDLVRLRQDGDLDFIGRFDDQIKIRGYRVEPGEVERLLCQHPEVREAAVLSHGRGQDRTLVAFVVRRGALQHGELRAFAQRVLPDYMVPSKIIILTKIPATENGKRDRDALLAQLEAERARESNYEPPTGPSERLLAEIWTDLLALESVGSRDDFFALGGNSMLALRVRQRVKREAGAVLKFSDILEKPVLGDLAKVLETSMRTART